MILPEIDTQYLLKFLTELLNTPSPTGFAHEAIDLTQKALAAFPGLQIAETRKGALVAGWPGEVADAPRSVNGSRRYPRGNGQGN